MARTSHCCLFLSGALGAFQNPRLTPREAIQIKPAKLHPISKDRSKLQTWASGVGLCYAPNLCFTSRLGKTVHRSRSRVLLVSPNKGIPRLRPSSQHLKLLCAELTPSTLGSLPITGFLAWVQEPCSATRKAGTRIKHCVLEARVQDRKPITLLSALKRPLPHSAQSPSWRTSF